MAPLTLEQARLAVQRRLEQAGVPSAQHDARALAQHALGLSRVQLLTQAQMLLTPAQWAALSDLARRRAGREPLQHLLGTVEWSALTLKVSPAALIPRPETETLLHLLLPELWPGMRVLDIGTGSGPLALGIKQACPGAVVAASDISQAALALARENAALNALEVEFLLADGLDRLSGPYDLLVSNPPYLPDADALSAQAEVQRDPALALYSGPDGLRLARRLVREAPGVLPSSGVLWLELDPRNVQVLAAEVSGAWAHSSVHPDLTQRPRFLRLAGPLS